LLLAYLFWSDVIQTWHVLGLMFIRSLGGIFHSPAMFATTSLMVPQKHLARVAGVNQILDGGINVAGPALGALLMELLPIQGVLAVDVGTAALAVIPLLFIAVPQPSNGKEKASFSPKILLQEVAEGFRYVVTWRGMLIMILYTVLLNFLFSPTFTFLPLLVTEHFNGSAWQLGLLESLMGAGMLAGGVILSIWGGFKRKIVGVLFGLGFMSFALIIVGISPATAFSLAAGSFLFVGAANTLMNGSGNVILQSIVAPDMQGRVISLLNSSSSALQPIGLLLATPIVELFGARIFFIVSGLMGLIAAFGGFFIPHLMHLEEPRKPIQEPQDELIISKVKTEDMKP
jgi:DHA3 family macrolide efflux protein-like MFS transporter